MNENNHILASLQDAYKAISHAQDMLDQAENTGLKIHPSVSNHVTTAKLTLLEAMKDFNINVDLNTCVRSFYLTEYPTDDLGFSLLPDVTFKDVVNCLNNGHDLYETVGQCLDTVIRERIFSKVSELLDVDYLTVYHKWLYPKEYSALKIPAAQKEGPKRSLIEQIQNASQSATDNAISGIDKDTSHER